MKYTVLESNHEEEKNDFKKVVETGNIIPLEKYLNTFYNKPFKAYININFSLLLLIPRLFCP